VADLKAWIQRNQNVSVDSQLLLTSRAVQLKLESMSYGVSIFPSLPGWPAQSG